MNWNDSLQLELEALCNAVIDGAATEAEFRRLQELLRAHPEARAHYVRFSGLSASLHEYSGETQADAPDLPRPHRLPSPWLWWAGAGIAAAAAVTFALWPKLAVPNADIPTSATALTDDGDPDSVALLAAATDCRWSNTAWQPGDNFPAGQTLDLLEGFAEIIFDSGAKVVLQGPASLELTSAWQAALKHGILRANVPQEAIGFRVSNPEVDVVDLGTDFSVVTDDTGASEVFVHQGAVEVHPRTAATGPKPKKAVLREKEARRFAKSGPSEVREVERKWQALSKKIALPSQRQAGKIWRWNFANPAASDAPLTLIGTTSPATVAAPQGAGWAFDATWHATTSLPAVAGETGQTIALWARFPAASPGAESDRFLAWRQRPRPGAFVELGCNGDPAHGVIGAPTLRIGNRLFTGTTPLRDGLWHHLTAVVIRKPKPGGGSDMHGKFYVDGRLEPRSGKTTLKRARDSESADSEGLLLGRSLDGDLFKGDLGSLIVADHVLTQNEIRREMLAPR